MKFGACAPTLPTPALLIMRGGEFFSYKHVRSAQDSGPTAILFPR